MGRGRGMLLTTKRSTRPSCKLSSAKLALSPGSCGRQCWRPRPRMLLSQQKLGKPEKRRGKKGGHREGHRLPCSLWCNTQPISQTSGGGAAPRTAASWNISGSRKRAAPGPGLRFGRPKPPNHPSDTPWGPGEGFRGRNNSEPPPDLDHRL